MTAVAINFDTASAKADIDATKRKVHLGTIAAMERMGLYVEALAVENCVVNESTLRNSIYKSPVDYDPTQGTYTVRVGASAAHAIYVEFGFQGHFVPFSVSESLYMQALQRWGWKVAPPGSVKNPVSGRRYLIPRGRKNPVWGVFVKGTAKPFLRPAHDDLIDSGLWLDILSQEVNKALAST